MTNLDDAKPAALNFESDFRNSWNEMDLGGTLCFLFGISTPLVVLIVLFNMDLFSYQPGFATGVLLGTIVLSGPFFALSSISHNMKKQTSFIALQTWELQRKDNPDIGQYRFR